LTAGLACEEFSCQQFKKRFNAAAQLLYKNMAATPEKGANMSSIHKWLLVQPLILAPTVACASLIRSAQPFVGVTQWQYIQQLGDTTAPVFPREIVVNILEIDTQASGVSFLMQPGNGASPGEVTRQTTRAFVNAVSAQIGINGDFFDTNPPYPPSGGLFFTDVTHVGASNGDVYSTAAGAEPVFNITAGNTPSVLTAGPAGSSTSSSGTSYYNAIGGNQRILTNGAITTPNDSYTTTLNPHTAIGVSQDNRRVFLLTVDGRQTDYSEGMRTDEMAQLMLDFGVWNAINVDGGGSTTMIMDDLHDGIQNARVVNSPSDNATPSTPGTERLVANSLAVFAMPNLSYVPLPPIPRPGQTGVLPTLTALTVLDDFESGKGRFGSALTASGSSRNIAAASTSTVDTSIRHQGNSSLRLDIVNTNADPAQMKLRFLSGGGTPGNNIVNGAAMGPTGYVGMFLRVNPGNDPLFVALLIDDGTSTSNGLERSTFLEVIDDGEFHLYEWNLADAELWANFNAGNGAIDGPNAFLDAIYFSSNASTAAGGTNWAGQVWIDTVAYNPAGNLSALVPEPAAAVLMAPAVLFMGRRALRRRP
jgi:hypothetical protein